jgi:two-component system sensor histidine kinase HydH
LQLERSHKFSLIGQMAAGVAHEIKNPLASIKGAVEILGSGGGSDAERKEFQQIIVKEIKRIDTTVQEFLDFARPKEVQLKRIDLSEIVHSSIRQLENQVRQAGMEFDAHIANGLMTMADPEKIHQVIINLVLNAVQASQPGQNIKFNLAAKGPYAVITVQDYGAGLSVDDTEKIFDPFFTTKVHGIGLGLAIVKSIIERHKGDIKVESSPGKGTSFIVLIPLAEARK